MLTITDLNRLLASVPELQGDGHKLAANGYDGILAVLKSLRGTAFPVAILEARSSGQVLISESGPIDNATQSLWIMGQLGRDEDEVQLYDSMYALSKKIIAILLHAQQHGELSLAGWDWHRVNYMQRYGGPECRGYELVLQFVEYTELLPGSGSGSGSGSGDGNG